MDTTYTITDLALSLDTVWMLLAAMLVFFMQPGFALVEAGFTRTKNTANILMKNLLDFSLGSLLFWAVGFGVMFGAGGFIGMPHLFNISFYQTELPVGAVLIGAICGTVMIFAVDFIDHVMKIDDPVGASSVHGVCGFLGTILTGLFATEEGLFYSGSANFLLAQLFGAVVVGCWAAGMGFVVFKGLDIVHGLRVPARVEEEGLDIYEHGETAYNS